eukprot:600679-Rhodomonas_salina.2
MGTVRGVRRCSLRKPTPDRGSERSRIQRLGLCCAQSQCSKSHSAWTTRWWTGVGSEVRKESGLWQSKTARPSARTCHSRLKF